MIYPHFCNQKFSIKQMRTNMKMKYYDLLVLCSLVCLATGCKQPATTESRPVKVKIMRVESVPIHQGREFSGTIEESVGSTLSFPVAGTLEQIRVSAGQHVEQGELIAALDESTLRHAYEAASASLVQAEDVYQRMKQLHDNHSLPDIQWVEVQSKLKQAQSMERISRKNLEDGRLYAPFSGVISEKHVEVGQNVMPGIPVVKLVTVSPVKVRISVPENEISQVDLGQAVRISVSALGGKLLEGKVVEKGIAADPLSRSYEVKALVDNPSGELMPGMICELYLEKVEERDSAIVLPSRIVQLDHANHPFVWVHQSGKAHKRMVETGPFVQEGVTVLSGISVGDEVLVEGQQKVSEQMDIRIEN